MPRRATVATIASVAVHFVLLGAAALQPDARPSHAARAAVDTRALREACGTRNVGHSRAALVADARRQLREGSLALGEFLLQGNALDAAEAGQPFDLEQAQRLYQQRLQSLRAELAAGPLEQAVPEVFADLKYFGRPGGLMGEALLTGGGSCEQLSLLIAASAFDAGRPEVGLRFYGAPGPHGVAHVSPVVPGQPREHDLVSGRAALPGGALVKAEEMLEVYARAHGLGAAPVSRPAPAREAEPGQERDGQRLTLVAGFPPNADRFPGRLPLYAARAVQPPGQGGAAGEGEEREDPLADARRCGYYVRMAALDPSVVHADPDGSGQWLALEPRRVPHPQRLETQAALMRHAWQVAEDGASREGDRMMAHACVAALGELSAVDFALSGEPELSREAMALARQARDKGAALVRSWPVRSEPERARVRSDLAEHAGRTWLLLLLEGGEPVVVELLERTQGKGWGKVSALAGLLVWPASRQRALAMVERYPLDDQVDVMHEMYHAHDHMAPWASDFDMEITQRPAGPFLRGWRVFRGLAWRIWNGRRPVEELLTGLVTESSAAGLDAAWQAAFLEYTARNVLGLHAMRSSGVEPVRQLRRVAERISHPSMTSLSRRLLFIEQQGELTGPTLADAWQMK